MATKIDWPFDPFDVWNPVLGCKKNCYFCYAKRMNQRFKYIPVWENPVFFWDKLKKPYRTKKPTTFFVGSMCDLFGEWIVDDWIEQIIKVCEDNPRHTFLFLTKNPRRYLQFDFPDNVMLGTTLCRNVDFIVDYAEIYPLLEPHKTFISVEPILSDFNGCYLVADLVIVGAMTGPHPVAPKREWIESIKCKNIYYKKNILKYFPKLKNN
jgi:protein gp37